MTRQFYDHDQLHYTGLFYRNTPGLAEFYYIPIDTTAPAMKWRKWVRCLAAFPTLQDLRHTKIGGYTTPISAFDRVTPVGHMMRVDRPGAQVKGVF